MSTVTFQPREQVRPICFVDTETTGLDPRTRLPWEIFIIRREVDQYETTAHIFVADVDLSQADPKSLEVGGFYQRHPRAGEAAPAAPANVRADGERWAMYLSERSAAEQVWQMTADATLVAAIPGFDETTLLNLLWRNGLNHRWHYRVRDVESMAIGELGGWDPGGLLSCAEAIGIDTSTYATHTARGDAELVRDMFDAISDPGRKGR